MEMDERVRNGGIAGAAAFLVMVIIGIVWPDVAERIPTGTEAAITTVFATFIAWKLKRTPGKAPS